MMSFIEAFSFDKIIVINVLDGNINVIDDLMKI